MFYQTLFSFIVAAVFASSTTPGSIFVTPLAPEQQKHVLAIHEMPLDDRYGNPIVNDVFKDNILLTMSYFSGTTKQGQTVDWNDVRKPFTYDLALQPGEVFAFHNGVL